MIGKDGQFGGALVLDGKLSLHNVAVQINGTASILRAEHVKIMFAECPDFKKILLSYEQFAFAQAQQTAACNATHSVQARACKWLSRMYDLAGEDLYLTQEFLAQMIGVRRTSVSKVAAELQDMNLISYSRGRVRIDNIEHIRQIACECDDAVRDSYGLLFPSDAGHAHL